MMIIIIFFRKGFSHIHVYDKLTYNKEQTEHYYFDQHKIFQILTIFNSFLCNRYTHNDIYFNNSFCFFQHTCIFNISNFLHST